MTARATLPSERDPLMPSGWHGVCPVILARSVSPARQASAPALGSRLELGPLGRSRPLPRAPTLEGGTILGANMAFWGRAAMSQPGAAPQLHSAVLARRMPGWCRQSASPDIRQRHRPLVFSSLSWGLGPDLSPSPHAPRGRDHHHLEAGFCGWRESKEGGQACLRITPGRRRCWTRALSAA
jgi:hypothetical protein